MTLWSPKGNQTQMRSVAWLPMLELGQLLCFSAGYASVMAVRDS